MPKDKTHCKYTYNSGRPCNCEVDFHVRSITVRPPKPAGLCMIHLGFYLMKHANVSHAVARIVPREKRA